VGVENVGCVEQKNDWNWAITAGFKQPENNIVTSNKVEKRSWHLQEHDDDPRCPMFQFHDSIGVVMFSKWSPR